MLSREIQVGAIYDLGGGCRFRKRVVTFDPSCWRERGGFVRAVSVRPDGTCGNPETFAGRYFSERAVELPEHEE